MVYKFYGARLDTFQRESMPDHGVKLSKTFIELGTDIIVYSCAETSFLKGVDGNEYISNSITELTGQPAVTATTSMVDAAKHLNVQTVSLVTPYTDQRTDIMIEFFERMGLKVNGVEIEDFSHRSNDSRKWYECNIQPPFTAYQMARKANRFDSDAVIRDC